MSDRDVTDNARRKGKKAYHDGVSLDANPMRAALSRLYWELGWKAEQHEMTQRRLAQSKWGPLARKDKEEETPI